MRKNTFKKCSLLFLVLFLTTVLPACTVAKDKENIISQDVSQEVKEQEIEVQRNIELGNKYLDENSYEEAKKSYEKAISLDTGNKQSYLTIKEMYMEKGRLDDAFYIIKLAIENKVDTANMQIVLDSIKQKFEVTNLQDSTFQNYTYNLPKEVNLKINNEDTKAAVEWKASSVDTSKTGMFVLEGKAEQYGRTVKLTLNIKPIVKAKILGYVKSVFEKDEKRYMAFNDVEMLSGEAAIRQMIKDGTATKDENGNYIVYDDYYMHDDDPKIETIEISNSVSISVLPLALDPFSMENQMKNIPVSYKKFKDIIDRQQATLYWMYTENDVIVKIEAQYVP